MLVSQMLHCMRSTRSSDTPAEKYKHLLTLAYNTHGYSPTKTLRNCSALYLLGVYLRFVPVWVPESFTWCCWWCWPCKAWPAVEGARSWHRWHQRFCQMFISEYGLSRSNPLHPLLSWWFLLTGFREHTQTKGNRKKRQFPQRMRPAA